MTKTASDNKGDILETWRIIAGVLIVVVVVMGMLAITQFVMKGSIF